MTATFSVWAAGSAAGATAMAQYLSGPTLDHERAKYYGAPELRPDLSPALAERLGINQSRPLTEGAISHLFNARKVDGSEIEGRRINKPMRSLVETFGLDPVQRPEGEALANVLAGRRVDGSEIEGPVAGALKRFEAAMAERADYKRLIHATKAPVGGIDLTFSADKSLSVSFALGSETDRVTILGIHQRAVADALAFVEKKIGFATMGAGGRDGVEAGDLAWVTFQHFTARPAVDIIRKDKDGADYTDRREVPMQAPDPQIHSHAAILNHVHTASGRLGAIDLDLLKGFVHQAGAVYHARIAAYANQAGIETALGPSGETRFTAVPDQIRDAFSKRSREAGNAARDLARGKGLDWDTLTGEQQIGLLKAGAGQTRNKKVAESRNDFEGWAQQAVDHGYRHQSVVRPDAIKPERGPETAYEMSLPLIGKAFTHANTLDENELRVMATRGFIAAGGIGADAERDIEAVMSLYRQRGVMQDGQQTAIEWGTDVPLRGKQRISVTTSLHADQERELVTLAQDAAADRTGALSVQQIDRAADAFLARHPEIDRDGPQWQAQRAMADQLAAGGKFSVGIGAAGAGKTVSLEMIVDAWKDDGRQVFGAALAWRQSGDLAAAGIADANRAAIDPFLKRAAAGKYQLDANSVVVVDEVSLLSTRQQLGLLRLQQRHGFRLAEVGDFNQLQSIEASAGIKLIRQALGDAAIPEISTSIRQKTERERELAGLFRAGQAAEALDIKRTDGTAILVPGGRAATAERVAQLWQDSGGKATISTGSNADVHEIGAAVRKRRQAAGEIGADKVTMHGLALTEGDRVRLFDRVHDAETGGRAKVLANNGDVVTIREIHQRYMRVENAKGDVGTVPWSKTKHGLAYGYAGTAHLAQGITSDNHIHAALDGTRSANAFSSYVAMSRHRDQAALVLNEAAIRREISKTRVAGVYQPIGQADIWRQAAADMSRKPERGSATEMLARVTERRRGSVADLAKTMDLPEQQGHSIGHTQFQRVQLSHAVKQAVDYVQEMRQRLSQAACDLARDMVRQRSHAAPDHDQYHQAHRPSRGMTMGR